MIYLLECLVVLGAVLILYSVWNMFRSRMHKHESDREFLINKFQLLAMGLLGLFLEVGVVLFVVIDLLPE